MGETAAKAMKRPGQFLLLGPLPLQIRLVHGTNQVIADAADNDYGRDGPKQ